MRFCLKFCSIASTECRGLLSDRRFHATGIPGSRFACPLSTYLSIVLSLKSYLQSVPVHVNNDDKLLSFIQYDG